jgi:hypothetical protein
VSTRGHRTRILLGALLALPALSLGIGIEGAAAAPASAPAKEEARAASPKSAPRSRKVAQNRKTKPQREATAPATKQEDAARSASAPAKMASIVREIHCPNGVLSDPHRGYVRCLAPDEKGARWIPPSPQPEPPAVQASASSPAAPSPAAPAPAAPAPSAQPSSPLAPPFVVPPPPAASAPAPAAPDPATAPAAAPPVSTAPPAVEIKEPTFENGEVPRAEKFLGKLSTDIGQCIAKHGGLSKASGSMKVQFIVRARGRAEGVEILSSQGVTSEANACVRLLLKNKSVGAPTADPVGVTFVVNLKAAPK